MVDRTDSPSRHLVDPELVGRLDEMGGLNLSAQTLDAARTRERQCEATGCDQTTEALVGTECFVPGSGDDPQVRVLVYRPEAAANGRTTPALVWIHGGGFVLGSADGDDAHCRMIAARTGAVVVSVDYRLAPETTEPGLVDDCYAALRWVHSNAAVLGVNSDRIALAGASAGGGLAACTALLARDRGEVPVCGQFLIYPMLDDRTASTIAPGPYVGEFGWSPSDNRFGWSSHLGRQPGGADVSPYTAAARADSVGGLPPTFICVGSLDLFAGENLAYAARLIEAGVPTELHVYPGAYHGFDASPEARVTRAHLRDFVDALTRHFHDDVAGASTAAQ